MSLFKLRSYNMWEGQCNIPISRMSKNNGVNFKTRDNVIFTSWFYLVHLKNV